MLEERCGSGSFGVVWRARRAADGGTYALKEVPLQGLSREVRRPPTLTRLLCLRLLRPAQKQPPRRRPGWPGARFRCMRRVQHNITQHMHAKPNTTQQHAPTQRTRTPHIHCVWRQEQQQCIRETQVLSAFDSDFVVRFWDAFLEQVMAVI